MFLLPNQRKQFVNPIIKKNNKQQYTNLVVGVDFCPSSVTTNTVSVRDAPIIESEEPNLHTGHPSSNGPTNSNCKNQYNPKTDDLYQKCRKLGLNYQFPSDLESAEERRKRKQRLRSKITFHLKTLNIPEN